MGMQEFHKLRQKKSSLYGVPLLPLQSLHIRAPKHFFGRKPAGAVKSSVCFVFVCVLRSGRSI